MTPNERIAKLREAKAAGMSAEVIWTAVIVGTKLAPMKPSCAAMSKAEWFLALERVFGKRAAARIRARGYTAL